MVLKIINATEARVGTNILLDGKAFTIKKIDISKTGKHGHAKCRIEADSIIGSNRKVFVAKLPCVFARSDYNELSSGY